MSNEAAAQNDAPARDISRRADPPDRADRSHGSPEDPAWGVQSQAVSRWEASVAVIAAAILYIVLPDQLTVTFGPRWLRYAVPGLEVILLVPLALTSLRRRWQVGRWQRPISLVLIAIVNAANILSLGYLVYALLHGRKSAGYELLVAAVSIWLTNIIVFGLWYWELDRGGPLERCRTHHREPDFLFPQMSTPGASRKRWAPSFVDYLYLSYTNATAFSPTDTMPLTEWAKALMMVQAATSLLTVALVAARAVNILS